MTYLRSGHFSLSRWWKSNYSFGKNSQKRLFLTNSTWMYDVLYAIVFLTIVPENVLFGLMNIFFNKDFSQVSKTNANIFTTMFWKRWQTRIKNQQAEEYSEKGSVMWLHILIYPIYRGNGRHKPFAVVNTSEHNGARGEWFPLRLVVMQWTDLALLTAILEFVSNTIFSNSNRFAPTPRLLPQRNI